MFISSICFVNCHFSSQTGLLLIDSKEFSSILKRNLYRGRIQYYESHLPILVLIEVNFIYFTGVAARGFEWGGQKFD